MGYDILLQQMNGTRVGSALRGGKAMRAAGGEFGR